MRKIFAELHHYSSAKFGSSRLDALDVVAVDGKQDGSEAAPELSIILPARNEETNLPKFFSSISRQSSHNFELIVVDDQSTDETYQLALDFADQVKDIFRVTVVQTKARPIGWTPKVWACHSGVQFVKSKKLLFVDADIVLSQGAVREVAQTLEAVDALSAVPMLHCLKPWEKLQGVFWAPVILSSHVPFSNQQKFSIGQFLGFTSSAYVSIGGHQQVRQLLCEDVAMEALLREIPLNFQVFHPGIYQVRMYSGGPIEFYKGWVRIIRQGLATSGWKTFLATFFCVAGAIEAAINVLRLDATSGWSLVTFELVLYGLWSAMFFHFARKLSITSLWAAAAFPLPVFVFAGASIQALLENCFKVTFKWKGRKIKV